MTIQTKLRVDLSALPNEEKFARLYPMFKSRVEERCPAEVSDKEGAFTVRFLLDETMTEEAFDISDTENGLLIKGGSFKGLVFGLGQLLHKSRYYDDGMHITDWRGYSAPDCSFRVIYFAAHFNNWYHNTARENLAKYLEDLMLWGYNGICCFYKDLFVAAKKLDLITVTIKLNSAGKITDPSIAADVSGLHQKDVNLVCPSNPKGYEFLSEKIVESLKVYAEDDCLDYLLFFPYDAGGCTCEMCKPWGGNGYYRFSKRLYNDVKKILPNIKAILANWHFELGPNDKRDYPWLDRAVREDKYLGDDWVDYMMLYTRDGIQDWVKNNGVPGGCRGIDFPEITMRNLEPWGGYGAVCTPDTIDKIWKTVSPFVDGGMPYSEGHYDDINKALSAGLFWERNRSVKEIFTDYCGYEFREEIADDLFKASNLMDKNQVSTHTYNKTPADMEEVKWVRETIVKIDASLPESIKTKWQWRLFYIRALLDYERYAGAAEEGWTFEGLTYGTRFGYWKRFMQGSRLAQKLLHELIEIYEMPEVYDPAKHFRHPLVRPLYTGIVENFESHYAENNKK